MKARDEFEQAADMRGWRIDRIQDTAPRSAAY
jgi:hypothetical protein